MNPVISLLVKTGFVAIQLIKRFPYRVVLGHSFFSLTYSAVKPIISEPVLMVSH
ncbi:MAG: hypothetical protein V2B19_20515 [Pseudomonadota bacterium]